MYPSGLPRLVAIAILRPMGGIPEGARHYRGLVVEAYDLWLDQNPPGDADYFRWLIEDDGQPALEVACGTGRLLLPYLAEGLDVDGVDASEPMLEACRAKAAARGLEPVLHLQPMEALDLSRRYRTVFVPYGSFQALVPIGDVEAALEAFRRHLAPEGRLVLALFTARDDYDRMRRWRIRREATRPDGATILMHEAVAYDRTEQVRTDWYRYELIVDGEVTRAETRRMRQRWYTKHEIRLRLERAGFREVVVYGDYGEEPFGDAHAHMIVIARRAD